MKKSPDILGDLRTFGGGRLDRFVEWFAGRPASPITPRFAPLHRGAARRALLLGAAALGATGLILFASGCDEHDGWYADNHAPAAPTGFRSVTGDHQVYLSWSPNQEDDLDGYIVYRSREPRGVYPRIAEVGPWATEYVDSHVENGVTYYYAISAVDDWGNESELASEWVQDTPRPEGWDVRLYNANDDAEDSGYDFSRFRVIDYRDIEADVYFVATEEDGPWMVATERSADSFTDIQDAGYVELDQVDVAPEEGWSPTGEVLLIPGHSYVVWAWDNHFAKFRVIEVNGSRCVLDWAYQVDRGNRELAWDPSGNGSKPARTHAAGGGTRTHHVGAKGR